MARLFGREYHNHSNTWYFKNTIKHYMQNDIKYRFWKNDDNNFNFEFEAANPIVAKSFNDVLTIVYCPEKSKILSFSYPNCTNDDICPQFLSILQYAYKYLSTDILTTQKVQTYQSKMLNYNEYWQRVALNGKILISDIYNTNLDKVRFWFDSYNPFDVRLIATYLTKNELPEKENDKLKKIEKQAQAFSDEEIQLLKLLQKYKCSFSRKSVFFSVYKSDFIKFFPVLKSLNNVYIKETADKLEFSSQQFAINFKVNKTYNGYLLRINSLKDYSSVYTGATTYILKRNVFYRIQLPFLPEVTKQIFSTGLAIDEKDLIYLSSVVSRQLSLVNCYLDFDEEIEIPKVIDNTPTVCFKLFKEDQSIIMEGNLEYDDEKSIPLTVLRYPSELVKYDDFDTWFYVPPQIRYQVFSFIEHLPEADENRLETKSQLVFVNERAHDELKKTIFELAPDTWKIELSQELKNEFIYKVHLTPEIEAKQSDEINWFEYKVSYRFKDIKLSHEELKSFFKTKKKFLKLKDGRLLYFSDKDAFNEVEYLLKRAVKDKEEVYRSQIYNIPYLYQLPKLQKKLQVNGDSYLDGVCQNLLNRHLPEKKQPVSQLQPIMRSYQKAGYSWMNMLKAYGFNGILADDMGLGKTLQAISVLSDLPLNSISLVVCPKTLLFNWGVEIKKFNPSMSFIIYEGPKEQRLEMLKNLRVNVVLASYSIIQNDLEALKDIEFDVIILDEAQHIKNPSALRTKAIKKIKSKNRIALTGTPMENSPAELWSIFDFLMPGYLPSLSRFKKDYLSTEEKINSGRLTRLFSPFILRRHKKDVLIELPDKQEQTVYCGLTPFQEKLYMQIIESAKNDLMAKIKTEGASKNYLHILAALTKLRQICNHPSLISKDIKKDTMLSGKLELLKELITDAVEAGKKILIFSQFVQMLQLLKQMLTEEDICFEYLDGSTKKRQQRIDNFNNNQAVRAFLISLKTGGYGLNLTAADTVILVDPWWNPMGENQAIDRAYRIGQTKKVMVYKIITQKTIEEKILVLQANKKKMFENLIEEGQNIISNMSVEELQDLFTYNL